MQDLYGELPESLQEVCLYIQCVLKKEFPELRKWKGQCKRAGVMLDVYCKKQGIQRRLVSGWIHREGDTGKRERGHVWILIKLKERWYVLDLTLLQFEDYLGMSCPQIIFGPKKDIYERYSYMQDCYGTYRYNKRDFVWSLEKIGEYLLRGERKSVAGLEQI